jgi:1-deoxy-D-xylulose-5-phosphate reductoisomerase
VTERIRLAVLGSTGSIGRQALEVAAMHPDRVEVVGIAARSSAELIVEQARELAIDHVVLEDPVAAERARELTESEVLESAADVVALAEHPDVDVVLNALVGSVGLRATIAALRSGKTLALANKESLVVGGSLVTALAEPGQLVPVDSEHSAIFQCLTGEDERDVACGSRRVAVRSGGWTARDCVL